MSQKTVHFICSAGMVVLWKVIRLVLKIIFLFHVWLPLVFFLSSLILLAANTAVGATSSDDYDDDDRR